MDTIKSNKIYEPWGYQEETNYESLQNQSAAAITEQDARISELEDKLNDEIARSEAEDTKHDAYEGDIKANQSAITENKTAIETNKENIEKKADKKHTHEITDLRQDGSPEIVIDANKEYETTPDDTEEKD